MVKAVIVIALSIASSTGVTYAESTLPEYRCEFGRQLAEMAAAEKPHSTLFGFRYGFGKLPIGDRAMTTSTLGIGVEHRIHGGWRLIGEYEYLWIGERDTERKRQDVIDGAGHRAHVGIRRTLLATRKLWGGTMRFYVDAELGGGLMLASEPEAGTLVKPHLFAGIRFGYDFMSRRSDTKASTVWEPEILLRAISIEDGAGLMFGIGMNWGR